MSNHDELNTGRLPIFFLIFFKILFGMQNLEISRFGHTEY